MVTMVGWSGGLGWLGLLSMSVGVVAFWVLAGVAIVALLPGIHDESAHRRGPRSGGAQ